MSLGYVLLVKGWISNGPTESNLVGRGQGVIIDVATRLRPGELRTDLTHARWCDRLRMACASGEAI